MKNLNKKLWNLIVIIIGYLLFGVLLFMSHFHAIRFSELIFWSILFLYVFPTTYWLYKLEWRKVLGLFRENITKKIMKQAFGRGLLLGAIVNISTIFILIIFKAPISFPFANQTDFEILFGAILIAPIAEELLFRGFLQGILQKNYPLNENRTQVKIVIIIIAFLFTIAHVRYIVYTETLQWVMILLGIFIFSLYLGDLRAKHQSIIPSIFAHLGFNLNWIVAGPIIGLMIVIFQPVGFGRFQQQIYQREYENDSIYNFDPNDWGVLFEAQRKFLAFHNPPHPEFKPYMVKGRNVSVWVLYDIDTCGVVYNVRIDSTRYEERKSYTNHEIEKEAIRLVESFPPHKPLIKDGTRGDWGLYALVPIYY